MEKIQQLLMDESATKNYMIRCNVCTHLLSISPIVHNDTLGSICGRENCRKFAKNTKGINIRQSAYEAIARFLEFPCMYTANGCQENLHFDEIGEHEKKSQSCIMEKIQQLLMDGSATKNYMIRCNVCTHLLSISPIVHNDTLGSICGRENCRKFANTKGINIRQSAYEAIARFLEFPCMYTANGCQENLHFDEIGEHEKRCKFMTFVCPFSTDEFEEMDVDLCSWKGNYFTFLDHMEEVHKLHKFGNYLQINLENDLKRNKLFFSRLKNSIVILLVVIVQKSSHWKVCCGSEIWNDMNYKIEILTEKAEIISASNVRKPELIHPAFFKSEINKSWFKVDLDQIENFFGFPNALLKTKFYMNGLIVGQSQFLSSNPLCISLKSAICGRCDKGLHDSIFVCGNDATHTLCSKCMGQSTTCVKCRNTMYKSTTFENLKFMIDQAYKQCRLCDQKVKCLSTHLYDIHNESIYKLDECYDDFNLPNHYFAFDDHVFLLTKEFSAEKNLSFSVKCLESCNVRYKYELKLMDMGTTYVAIIFNNFCKPEFINTTTPPETLIPYKVLKDLIPFVDYKNIRFKLSIYRIDPKL